MNSPTRKNRASRGFSLIEVLAAMAVLSIIVLIVSKMFVDANQAWAIGTRRVEQDIQARSALEWMTRELATAMADGVLSMKVEPGGNTDYYGNVTTNITFTSKNHRAEYRSSNPYREVQQIRYMLFPLTNAPPYFYTLGRQVTENESVATYQCYVTSNWTANLNSYAKEWANVIAEHVARFDVCVFITNSSSPTVPIPQPNYDSTVHPPPIWIDLALVTLDENDARKAANVSSGNRIAYIDRTAKRYVARAYPHNVQGCHVR